MIDPATASDWFRDWGPALVLYPRQLLPAARAEDVVQDAFIHLLVRRTAPDNVKAWLYRTVRNAALSELRSGRRRRRREQLAAARRGECFRADPSVPIDARAAADALAHLPSEQREIVVLRIWADLTLAEIAAIVHLPTTTVFRRYRQALAAIRKRMKLSCETDQPKTR